MSKKKFIMIGIFLILILFVGFQLLKEQGIQKVGFMIVSDGETTSSVSTEDTKLNTKNEPNTINNTDTKIETSTITMTNTLQEESKMFYATDITKEIKVRISGKSYADNCDVPYDELRYVNVQYWGFDGQEHTGELIVNKAIAKDIVDIFKELYQVEYPIEQMVLIDEYDADDNASMEANNTSAFCYRVIDDGSKRLSKHSYGLAIDINPLYNPYVRPVDGELVVSPEKGEKYADRTLDCPYYIQKGDACYKAFISRGFTWGGDWINQKDYQHFQKVLDKPG